ncbi:MAG: amidohydrolase family protein [Planctomycetes bacterium]|nr:amidohydrolase family protein [Planctomycetota bacterium]
MSRELARRFMAGDPPEDCPLYEMHAHWGMHYAIHLPAAEDGEARKLLEGAKVRRVVLSHHFSLFSPDIGNRASIETVEKMPDLLRAYCTINPNYPEEIARDLDAFDNYYPHVFVGFKLLSDYHKVPLTDSRYQQVWEKAQEMRLLVLCHTWGGSCYDGYEQIKAIAERYPDVKFLMGHSLHGDWDHAIELARNFPNLYLELTAVLDERGVVERFVKEAGSRKVVFGTDFPWFSQHYYLGALIGAGIEDEDLRNILYRNAMDLLGE